MSTLNPGRISTAARPVPPGRSRREKAPRLGPDRDAQARSFVLRRRLRVVRRGLALALVAALAIVGWWSWDQGHAQRLLATGQALFPRVADIRGLAVARVEVSGTGFISSDVVAVAAAIPDGAKIAELDLAEVRQRVEALGWVKSAQVSRLLPDTVRIKVVEREPFARWQFEETVRLIDRDGVEISDTDIAGFENLPFVVSDGAPAHAAALFDLLATEPMLAGRVAAAVRVGDRRWNVRFQGGVDVLLPEEAAENAWHRLATLERNEGILERDIVAIDLRLPDRLTVRPATKSNDTTDGS